MITVKSFSGSGIAISYGRRQLTATTHRARFHLSTSSGTSPRHRHVTRQQQHTIYRPSVVQVRSISLWGWGAPTNRDTEFAKAHGPPSSSTSNPALGHDGQILEQGVTPSSQSIPAVHQTSDVPPLDLFALDAETTSSNVTSSPPDQLITAPGATPTVDVLDPISALSSTPERIGYLKEVCGIDFGWGPSSLMQMILEHIHIYGGFTWATSIVILAVITRLVIFLPLLRSSDMSARLKALGPILQPPRDRMRAAYKAKDHRGMAEAKAELRALHKEYNIKLPMMFIPVLLQIPLQFGSFRVLRNMAELPVPAFQKENWLWTQDLTHGDPFFIIPVVNSAIIYLTIKRGGEMGNDHLQGGLMLVLSRVMPVLSLVFMVIQPGAVQLYFVCSGLLAITQSRLLTNKAFRSALGLHPVGAGPKELPSTDTIPKASRSSTPGTPPLPPTTGPAGLKLYHTPRSTQVSPTPPQHSKNANISLIDKVVDGAKARKDETVKAWYDMLGTTREQGVTQARRQKELRESENYVKMMQREEEWKREERNRLAAMDRGGDDNDHGDRKGGRTDDGGRDPTRRAKTKRDKRDR